MRLLSPDELSEEQRSVLDSYRPLLPEGAICVNVMLGAEKWDIRPLVLEGKQVSLCRISRPLSEAQCKTYAAELEGFSVIGSCPGKVVRAPGAQQFFFVRPYVNATLKDQIDSGDLRPGVHNLELAMQLFARLREMRSCSLIHGHICPANLAVVEGALTLLDPLIGAVNCTQEKSVPPELSPGEEPADTADLFGLGFTLSSALGDELSPQQQQVVKRLMLPSPRQRPSLEEAEDAFGYRAAGVGARPGGAGKMIKRGAAAPGRIAEAQGRSSKASASWGLSGRLLAIAVAVAVAGYGCKALWPESYQVLMRRAGLSTRGDSVEWAAAWSSGDAAKMKAVARAALMSGDAAAQDVIIDAIMGGENPPKTTPRLMRVGLNDLWRDQLSDKDVDAVIRLTVASLFKEGLDRMPPLASLHPGVILAVAGEMPPADPTPQLKLIPISAFVSLPDPFGASFRHLNELGVSSAGAPESVALAAIMSGLTSPQLFDAFMGADTSPRSALAKLSIILPIVGSNDAATAQLAASIRDRGGELGQVLGWFDIDDLAKWSKIPGSQKLGLALNQMPEATLTQAQYADLMTFPLPGVREQAALALKKSFFRDIDGNLLLTLSGQGNRLSREETVALVAALALEPSKRVPFIGAWFGLKPSPDTVLLLLLARSGYDSTDTFNLEAARYLRRNQWTATTEMLKLLAQHPEPLARTLAYTRLDPRDDAQKKILQERISAEKDQGLLKMVMGRLSVDMPIQPTAAAQTPR